MALDLGDLASIAAVLTALYALYNSIKTTGANKMKNQNEIDQLKTEVQDLRTRLTVAESCNAKNDKTIGVMQADIEWIKKGIEEIKGMLSK